MVAGSARRWMLGGLTLAGLSVVGVLVAGRSHPPSDPVRPAGLDSATSGLDGQRTSVDQNRMGLAPSIDGTATDAITEDRPTLGDCLVIADSAERQDCFRARLGEFKTELQASAVLGQLLCPRTLERAESTELIMACLDRFRNGDLLQLMGAVRNRCPGWRSENAFLAAVLQTRTSDEQLFLAIRHSLIPEVLFDSPYGELGIRIAGAIARETDDTELTAILREGALGNWGGTEWQIDYAIMDSLRDMPEGAERLEFIREILASPNRPADGANAGMGASLMANLASPVISKSCTEEVLRDEIRSLLDDETLGHNAAAQMLKQMNRDVPPPALSLEAWHELWQHAEQVEGL